MSLRLLLVVRSVLIVLVAAGISALIATLIVRGQNEAELRACHRLNIVRADENQNWLIAYEIISAPVAENHLQKFAIPLAWIPLTNCRKVVFSNMPAPNPVRFSVRLPSLGALKPGPMN